MNAQPSHAAWRERVADAVIERVPPDQALADHLAACAECTDSWRRLGGASARLIAAGRTMPLEAVPPHRLRERVLAARRALATASGAPPLALEEPRLPAAGVKPPVPAAQPTPVMPPTRGTGWTPAARAGRGWLGRLSWATAGAAAGALAMLAVVVLGTPKEPPGQVAMLGTEMAPDASGWVTREPQPDGTVRVRLAISGLPASGPDDFYELWLVGEGGRMSAGTFRSDGTRVDRVFAAAADLAAYPRLGITLEPDDGDPAASDQKVAASN